MLRKAILVDADYRSRVEREVIRLVERYSLWCTIDTRVRDKKRLEKVGNLVKNSYLYR